ncbi:hypothetical protein [Shinella sp. PSBB067]|nr:hypothetical protein [Shinella sp. PSBB067]
MTSVTDSNPRIYVACLQPTTTAICMVSGSTRIASFRKPGSAR